MKFRHLLAAVCSLLAFSFAHAIDGEKTTFQLKGIFCGNVTLDVVKGADGTYYLYDPVRNIYVVNAGILPSVNELYESGKLKDIMPEGYSFNGSEDDFYKVAHDIIDNKETFKRYLEPAVVSFAPGAPTQAYRFKSISIEGMTDEDTQQSLMPSADSPLLLMRMQAVYNNTENNTIVDRLLLNSTSSPIVADRLDETHCMLPNEGATLKVLVANDMYGETAHNFEVSFVPDESGKFVFDQNGFKGTIIYEPAPLPYADILGNITRVYDYFLNVHGFKGYDGKGSALYNAVFLPGGGLLAKSLMSNDDDDDDSDYEDGVYEALCNKVSKMDEDTYYILESADQIGAYAIDAMPCGMIYYGTGGYSYDHDVYFCPGLALSIMGHEFTHHVNNATANIGSGDESNSLNESFADIMGISFIKNPEYGLGPDQPWLMGGDGFLLDKSNLRDFSNPHNCMDGGDPCPDTYKGTYWNETNIYNMMAVQNKFYYLLCEGGEGTNDNAYDSHVDGIGVDVAQHIAFKTLTEYCKINTDYSTIRDCWLKAAEKLHGADSDAVKAVKQAWDAVGIYENGVMPTGIETVNERAISELPLDNSWYTIDGRRLNGMPVAPGIYLHGGKKVMMKTMFLISSFVLFFRESEPYESVEYCS